MGARMIPVFGIDPHVSHVAIACADGETVHAGEVFCAGYPNLSERLVELERHTGEIVNRWEKRFGVPACVAVELPTGRFPNPNLTMACGTVLLATQKALPGVPVWTLGIGEWKKGSVGRGDASKGEVAEWARSLTLTTLSQDEADAIGIAVACRSMLHQSDLEAA